MRIPDAIWLIASLLYSSTVSAHEVTTHTLITAEAYMKSKVNATTPAGRALYADLGIAPLVLKPIPNTNNYDVLPEPFGDTYFHMRGSDVVMRKVYDYERKVMEDVLGKGLDFNSLYGWIMRGVIREDDYPRDDIPQDDPFKNRYRVFNHFFEPRTGIPLSILGFAANNQTNPKWALGVVDIRASKPVEDVGRENNFSVYDAREAMFRALTNKTRDGNDIGDADRSDLRATYWATTFRALGDVLHLNQDMSQPQHARNEAHSAAGEEVGLDNKHTGHASVFESYLDQRARRMPIIEGGFQTASAALEIGGANSPSLAYPIPRFDSFAAYWTSGEGDVSLTGKGIADYSNHNFFTAGKGVLHIDSVNTRPVPLPGYYDTEVDISSGSRRTYLVGYATDFNTNNTAQFKIARKGMWAFAALKGGYTLDRTVYDDMARLLLPRAASYSSGILDYFFRGQMRISLPLEGVYGIVDHSDPDVAKLDDGGFKKLKLKVENLTRNVGGGVELMSDGKLYGVVRYRRNLCHKPDLTGEPGGPEFYGADCRSVWEEVSTSDSESVSGEINTPATQEITFNFPTGIPINATDVFLQVVFRGTLGNETGAVVVATEDISEPMFVDVVNFSDCYRDPQTGVYSNVDGFPFTTSLAFETSPYPIVKIEAMPPKTKSRFAILSNGSTVRMRDTIQPFNESRIAGFNQEYNENDRDTTVVGKLRPSPEGDMYFTYSYGYQTPGTQMNCSPMPSALRRIDAVIFE